MPLLPRRFERLRSVLNHRMGDLTVVMEQVAFKPLRSASFDTLLLTSFALSAAIHVVLQISINSNSKIN